jgi:aminopeptidase N
MARTRAPAVVAAALAVALGAGCAAPSLEPVAPVTPTTTGFTAGAPALNDPYVDGLGNGGYDVSGYALKLRYDPATHRLTGQATITARATQDLSQFNLDLRALTVSMATVDGRPAATQAVGDELIVTPEGGVAKGTTFVTVIVYGGVPRPYQEPGLGGVGFLTTPDGAIAIGEPEVAAAWFPSNDHPSDKATYEISIEAPSDLAAISNGVLAGKSTDAGWTTWNWVEAKPMATYLATVVIGNYRVQTSTHDGLPVVNAVAASLPTTIDAKLARTPEIIDFLETQFGPYPMDALGGIVVADQGIKFALENQTRPIYGPRFFEDSDPSWVLAHELAHQWYGDSVSLNAWRDVWLNEGPATYAEWLWIEHQGQATAKQIFENSYKAAGADLWADPPGAPTKDKLFGQSVYERGALTLGALRKTVGDTAFFTILKRWAADRAGGNGTTDQFIALAEEVSGQQLDGFFQAWLYGTTRPTL